ncbi:interleukin-1 receptor type 1-like isoform X2 [Hemicordylus capensis]|uniref:interleukin-1 receptor type 1-like isoform X2 n=1 Tax=Hemicordylus capensis TaxID=884348 RepID=UPI00230414AC|nr:interleukin-1 receptor type 1-like isoform X2 [Hemicordylus capensis]
MMYLLYFTLLLACFSVSEAREIWIAMENEAFAVDCPDTLSSEIVTWHHLGEHISTDKRARVHSVGKQLWFLPTFTEDSGDYNCIKHKYDPNTSETVRVTIQQHRQGICYYEDALYIETRGSSGSGRIPCPSFHSYKDASDIKWYKGCCERETQVCSTPLWAPWRKSRI